MVKGRKKVVILLLLVVFSLSLFIWFYISNRVYWKYDDAWMLGRTRSQIEERYGKFDQSILDSSKEVYIIKDNWLEFIDDGEEGYFVMAFNKSGDCIRVYKYIPPGF